MNYKVSAYGLTKEEESHLTAALPEEYTLVVAECGAELILTNGVCTIIGGGALDLAMAQTLANFFRMTDRDFSPKRVIWLGESAIPDWLKESFFFCTDISELLPELNDILSHLRAHFDDRLLCKNERSQWLLLSVRDMMEEEIKSVFNYRFGNQPEKELSDRLRWELGGILWEAPIESTLELLAVYQLTRWLKRNNYPYWCGNPTASSFVLYLLKITSVNPLPPGLAQDGHNFVWREFCGGGLVPCYVVHLPKLLMPEIIAYFEGHWLKDFLGDGWKTTSPGRNDHFVLGNMNFYFDIGKPPAELPNPSVFCREDVYVYLRKHFPIEKDAFRGMNQVQKGRGFPVITEEMRTGKDSWILDYCKNVKWLPSRANLLSERFFWESQGRK